MKAIYLSISLVFISIAISFSQNAYLAPALENAIDYTKTDEIYSVIVVMNEQLDYETTKTEFNSKNVHVDQRAKTTLKLLQQQSSVSQKEIISSIQIKGNIELVKQWYIFNGFLVNTDKAGINWLLGCDEVWYLDLGTQGIELVEPEFIGEPSASKDLAGPEIGLEVINAPPMWALGYTGRGTLIYGYDTGVWPDHPSYSDRYLGRFFPPEQCWYGFWNPEPTGILNDHGTHTLGTSIGLDHNTNDTIGVAWGAYWIATDIIRGTIDEIPPVSDMVDAFEWALNPDGDISTVDDIPDVINNSWRWRDEADTVHCGGFVVDLMNTIELVGIANVFSGGNSGPSNSSVNSPQRIKTNEVNTFCVGAIDGNSGSLPIVYFSTRGPSQCPVTDTSLSIHPEVVAPGYYVRSAWGSDEYNSISGTSMSCPHVSGALLLLKEAYPFLPGEELMRALYYTAIDMGDPGEDNVYGMGLIDVFAAYEYLALTYTPVPPVYDYDIAITQVLDPEAEYNCINPMEPAIFISNLGENLISDYKLYYSYNGGLVDSIEWSGGLMPGETMQLILPEVTLPAGDNILQLQAALPGGFSEVDLYNNYRYFELHQSEPFTMPFTEDFEDGIDTTLWIINNPDMGITWDTTMTMGLDSGFYSMFMDFGYGSALWEVDEITSPPIDMSTATMLDTVTLSFDLAYQKRSNTFQDSLKIFISDDCGNTFPHLIYAGWGDDLSTYDVVTPDFVPADASQWRREYLPITGLEADDMLRIKFWGWNKRGNHLYIDNIRLEPGLVVSADVIDLKDNINIYPNPADDRLYFSEKVSAELYSTTGKILKKIDNSSSMDVSTIPSGLYIVKITTDKGKTLSVKKIVIE